jgi:hypothetical protein
MYRAGCCYPSFFTMLMVSLPVSSHAVGILHNEAIIL